MASIDPQARAQLRASVELLRFKLSRLGERLDAVARESFNPNAAHNATGAARDFGHKVEGLTLYIERGLADLAGRLKVRLPECRPKGERGADHRE